MGLEPARAWTTVGGVIVSAKMEEIVRLKNQLRDVELAAKKELEELQLANKKLEELQLAAKKELEDVRQRQIGVLMKQMRVLLPLLHYWKQGLQFIDPLLLVLLNSFLSSKDLVFASPRRPREVAFFFRKISSR